MQNTRSLAQVFQNPPSILPPRILSLKGRTDVRISTWLLTAMAVSVMACEGDSNEPSALNIEGGYRVTWTDVGDATLSCSMADMHMTLSQWDTLFVGSYSEAYLYCDGQLAFASRNGRITNGTIDGDQVAFAVDTPDMLQTGVISGDTLRGTATWTVYNDASHQSSRTLTGTWVAVKQLSGPRWWH